MTYFDMFQAACTTLVIIAIWCGVFGYLASTFLSESKDDDFFEQPE